MSHTLLIDERPAADILLHRGHVVFPVRNPALYQRFEALALDAGVSIESVRGEPVEFVSDACSHVAKGAVGYLSEDLKPIAQLYAHLTHRRAVMCLSDRSEHSELDRSEHHVEIVVALTRDLTPALFDLLFNAPLECDDCNKVARPIPGLIGATDIASLTNRALLTAAALNAGPPQVPSQLDLGLSGAFAFTTSTGTQLSKTASRLEVREALRRGASLVVLRTHCDGIDALLLKDLTLCPRQSSAAPMDPATGPYCAPTGFCHRQGMSVDDAEREGRLVGPDAMSARVLLFATCQGALPINPVFGREWTLIDRFVDSLGVIAVVTTWESSIPPVPAVSAAAMRLRAGLAVGETVVRFNRSKVAKRFGCRMALFGDPRLTVAPRAVRARVPRKARAPVDSAAMRARLADAAFLRAYLTMSLTDLPARSAEDLKATQQAVLMYEYHLWHGAPVEGPPNAPGPALRSALLTFMAGRGSSPYHAWMALASDTTEQYGPTCVLCGQRTRLTMVDLRIAPRYRRQLIRCPVCGVIGEGPASLNMCLAIGDGSISLSGALPDQNWAGLLHITCQREEESVAFPWPADVDGRPKPLAVSQDSLPTGPLRVAAVLLQDATLSVLSLPVRKLTH